MVPSRFVLMSLDFDAALRRGAAAPSAFVTMLAHWVNRILDQLVFFFRAEEPDEEKEQDEEGNEEEGEEEKAEQF